MHFFDREKMKRKIVTKLEQLCNLHGVSGYEDEVTSYVLKELEGYIDEVKVDPLGNIIGVKHGSGKKKLMIAAHLDEIGLMIRHIDDRGFLYAERIGGVRPQNLFARTCLIKTEKATIKGLINSINPGRPKAMTEIPDVSEFFIDAGVKSRSELENLGIEIGNMVSINYEFNVIGNRVVGKALDNRLLVFILLEVMKIIKETGIETLNLYPVFTVQEEVGCRGAKTAAFTVDPDMAVALDITVANDTPQIPAHEYISQLDKGPAIKLMDRIPNGTGMIASPKIVNLLKRAASSNDINYQLEVFPAGSTDAATIHLERGGIPSGGISVPTRYVHAHEMASIDDIMDTISLLLHFIEEVSRQK
ncbi:M42 family metallopeptidase [Cytobacillus oceanisediminis]|nr:M42 family metallopeptidase [Cytobacillus oceanisediminis]